MCDMAQRQIDVSVIVPVYNVERHIEKCIRSLFEQTLDSIEYIFVNDCSNDSSMQVLLSVIKDYPDRAKDIQIVELEQNRGVAVARNVGLLHAKGEYVIFCDSDDWMDNEMLNTMYTVAEKRTADVVMCDFYMVQDTGLILYQTPKYCMNKVEFIRQYLRYTWTTIWNLLIRKKLLQDGGLQFPVGYTYCEDFNFAVKVFDTAKVIVTIDRPFYFYNRLNMNSVMRSSNPRMMHDEIMMYLDVISWFEKRNTFSLYEKQMSWRILKSKQEWLLTTTTYTRFLALFPNSHCHIWSCPYLNVKLKVMAWCLTHRLKCISELLLKLRNLKKYSLN